MAGWEYLHWLAGGLANDTRVQVFMSKRHLWGGKGRGGEGVRE
jgi:hypothetical protein